MRNILSAGIVGAIFATRALFPAEVTLFLGPSDFKANPGTWTVLPTDAGSFGEVLRGVTDNRKEGVKNASVTIEIPRQATYYIWARSRDFTNGSTQGASQGNRFYQISVGGNLMEKTLAKHGQNGWQWELAGMVKLPQGKAAIELLDRSAYYARCEALVLTTESDFKGPQEKDAMAKAFSDFPAKKTEAAPPIDYAVVSKDKSEYMGTVNSNDLMLDFKHPGELAPRDGLPNFFEKLRRGQPVTVAYLGGSITLAEGWRPKTTAWLKSRYPKAEVREINASVNGTGADFGACRVGREILDRKPDLLFVEYAVNGGEMKHMEGILRQATQRDPALDVCLVYTIAAYMLPDYQGGRLHAIAAAFDKVAAHYAVPSIAFGFQIAELAKSGRLVFQANAPEPGKILFSKDGVHPTDDGAVLYAGACARSLLRLESLAAGARPHALIEPMVADHWEKAKRVGFDKVAFTGAWFDCASDPNAAEAYGSGFPYVGGNLPIIKNLYPKLKGTRSPGASFTLRFKGTEIGFMDVGGPFAGQVKVSVDGAEPTAISRFNVHCRNIRHQYKMLPPMEDKAHTLVVSLDAQAPDKSVVKESLSNPEPYRANEFYLGGFMVIGELLP